jgi:8-oxo-dGTP pyrophosphatase MutT (NUDIX family)
MLFADGPQGPDVLLIERAHDLRSHAGQPAFPGGATDPTDDGPVDTAMREAVEEVGLDPASVRVLATMPPLFLPPSRFLVTPVLAWWREPGDVAPVDPAETAAVLRAPVEELADPANRVRVRHPRTGYLGPGFAVRGLLVWGFTAGLLDALLRLGGWERPWEPARVTDLPPSAVSAGPPHRHEIPEAEPESQGGQASPAGQEDPAGAGSREGTVAGGGNDPAHPPEPGRSTEDQA